MNKLLKHNNTGESQRHYAKRKKPDIKEYLQDDSFTQNFKTSKIKI